MFSPKPFCRGGHISQVGLDIRFREIALAVSQSGKIKPENGNVVFCQTTRNSHDPFEVFGAGKAMREQGKCFGCSGGHI